MLVADIREMIKDLPDDTCLDHIINRDDYIATKLWTSEDVAAKLVEEGYVGSEEEVAAVLMTGALKYLAECTDGDWEIIHQAILCAGLSKK